MTTHCFFPLMDPAKVLEGDLRLLSTEAKGFAAVKDSAERGIMKLKEVQDQFVTGEGRVRAPEFIRPFLLAANHTEAGKRVISVAIAAMQRLIMMDVVDRSEPPNILRVLFIQKDNPDEEVRIKILQTLPLLMKPAAYVATPQFICQCFEICFKMLHDKSPIIQHTSEATVRQLVALLFERLEAVASSPGDRSDIEHGAVLLLEDLCTLINNEAPSHIKVPSVSRLLCLELLDSILAHHGHVITLYPGLLECTRAIIAPLLLRALRYEKTFPAQLRVFRVVVAFAGGVGFVLPTECEILLAHVAALVEAGTTTVDCAHSDTTIVTKSRFGSAGAKIVADAHKWFSDKTSGPHARTKSVDEDDDDGPVGTTTLPKLVLALECWYCLTQQRGFLRQVFICYDRTPDRAKIFARMLRALQALLTNVLGTIPSPDDPDYVEASDVNDSERPSIDEDLFLKPTAGRYGFGRLLPKELDRIAARFHSRPLKNLELVDTLPSRLSIAVLPLLALQCLANVSDALSSSASSFHSHFAPKGVHIPRKVTTGVTLLDWTTGAEPTTPPHTPSVKPPPDSDLPPGSPAVDDSVLSEMAAVSWKSIVIALSAVLGVCEQEGIVQYILKSFQTFAATCGRLNLEKARDALLVSLCQFSLPNWRPSTSIGSAVMSAVTESGWKPSSVKVSLTEKHIWVFKALFNIAHCFGSVLGSSWAVLLDTFEQFDDILQKRNMGAAALLLVQPNDGLLQFSHQEGVVLPPPAIEVSEPSGAEALPPVSPKTPRRSVRGRVFNMFKKTGQSSGATAVSTAPFRTPVRGKVFDNFGVTGLSPVATVLSAAPPDDELTVLGTALNTLFEGTCHLPDDALLHLVTALSSITMTSLANAASSELVDDRLVHPYAEPSVSATNDASVARRPSTASLDSIPSVASTVSTESEEAAVVPAPSGFFGTALSAVTSVAVAAASVVGAKDWIASEPTPSAKKAKKSKKPKETKPVDASAKKKWTSAHRTVSESAEAATDAFEVDSDLDDDENLDGVDGAAQESRGTSPYEEYFLSESEAPRSVSLTAFSGLDKGVSTPRTPGGASGTPNASPLKPAPPTPALHAHALPGTMNTNASSQFNKAGSLASLPPPFALMKLIETARANIHRLSLLWETVEPLLKMLSRDRSPLVRQYGVSAAAELACKAVEWIAQLEEAGGHTGGVVSQSAVLGPLSYYWRSPFPDTRVLCLRAVHRVVEEAGVCLDDGVDGGWLTVLGILASVADACIVGSGNKAPPGSPRWDGSPGNSRTPMGGFQSPPVVFVQPTSVPVPLSLAIADPFVATAEAHGATLVPAGYKCVQLIADDFLTQLAPQGLSAFMMCLSGYCRQSADVNVSLTAVGVMWAVSDAIANPWFLETEDDAQLTTRQTPTETLPASLAISPSFSPDIAIVDSLWMQLAAQLCGLILGVAGSSAHRHSHPFGRPPPAVVTDTSLIVDAPVHPDVRNSAVQALFSSFATHYAVMSREAWHDVVTSRLLPLVGVIITACREAAKDTTVMEGEQLGKSKSGDAVRMILHHSRNTASKQWNEARVLALQGLARTLASGFPRFRRKEWFHDTWKSSLAMFQSCIEGEVDGDGKQLTPDPSDVGVSAVQALQELALLVCVPAGPAQTTNKSTISVGMKVVNGALVMGDGGGYVPPPAAKKQSPMSRFADDSAPSSATGSAKDGVDSVASQVGVSRTQLWHEIAAVLHAVATCPAVVRDQDEIVAVALLECFQNLIDSVHVPGSESVVSQKPSTLLSSRRAPVVFGWLEKLFLERRRARWVLAQESGGSTAVGVTALTSPRLNVLCNVERVTLRILENIGISLRLIGGAAEVMPTWQEWFAVMVRFVCMDTPQYLPPVSASSLSDVPSEGKPCDVALPLSAFDVNAAKVFADALQKEVPTSVFQAVFDVVATTVCVRVAGIMATLEVLHGVLVSAGVGGVPLLHEYGAGTAISSNHFVVLPLQVWGLTNIARTGSSSGNLVSDGERAKRLLQQCRDCVDTLVWCVVHLLGRGHDRGLMLTASVSTAVLGLIQALFGRVSAVNDSEPARVSVSVAQACVRQRSASVDASGGTSTSTSSASSANANVAPFVALSKVESMLTGLATRDWVLALGWPQNMLQLLSKDESVGASHATTGPLDVGNDATLSLLGSLLALARGDSLAGVSALTPLQESILHVLATGSQGLTPQPADESTPGDTVRPDSEWRHMYSPKRLRFARFCFSILFQEAASAGATSQRASFSTRCSEIFIRRCSEFLSFYTVVENAPAVHSSGNVPLPAGKVASSSPEKTMVFDAVLIVLALKRIQPLDAHNPELRVLAFHSLCNLIPTQAGLLRHVVKDALAGFMPK